MTSADRCEYINETIANYPLIRRMKYYHLLCQKSSISCFYDHQDYFCLCQRCFYGILCQFSSSLFDLSLDGIIGSHIQPNISLSNQFSTIKITLMLIILIVIFGFINGILSSFAFRSKETRRVGCGYYLFGSTITTLLTSIMLILKFSLLLSTQMTIDTNRTSRNIQCYSLDYLLQICLNMDKWLNACVALERAWNIVKGTKFNKEKSKKLAIYVIFCLIVLMSISTIHDPIHRQLVDDHSNDEQKPRGKSGSTSAHTPTVLPSYFHGTPTVLPSYSHDTPMIPP